MFSSINFWTRLNFKDVFQLLSRYISRLVVEYAYDPISFQKHADNIVKQLFDADGLFRELTRMKVGTSTAIVIRNDLIFVGIKNCIST